MPSVISSSDKKGWFSAALLKKDLSRFWPLWAIYGLVWFFALPMNILLLDSSGAGPYLRYNISRIVLNCVTVTPFAGAVYGVFLAMAMFSYLMNNRSTGMLHALPIRREGLFLTACAGAFVSIAGPTLAVALVALLAEGAKGALMPGDVFRWFGCNLMITLFFFAFAVFCAMFTGHILALPIFYGIMNFLVIGVCFLLDVASSILLIGFDGWNLAQSTLARWCTPVYQLYHLLLSGRGDLIQVSLMGGYAYVDGGTAEIAPYSVLAPVCYALVLCCFLSVLAVFVYRSRQLERAGDVVTVGVMRPVFQYGVGVCVGLALGGFLYYVFFGQYGPWAFISAVTASAFLGAFAARMFLKKSVHVFKDWKGPALCALAMLALLAGIRLDVFGLQRRVPNMDQVVSVTLSGVRTHPDDRGRYTNATWSTADDPRGVQEVIDFHKALVSDLNRLETAQRSGGYYEEWDDEGYQTVTLTYAMRDGSLVRRSYESVPITASELAAEGTYANMLQTLLNETDAVKRSYLRDLQDAGERTTATGGRIYNYRAVKYSYIEEEFPVELSYADANALWAAFLEDLDAGRARRYLLDDAERMENCYYYNDLVFEIAVRASGGVSTSGEVISIMVTPERSETSLMAELERLGLDRYLVGGDQD